MPTESVCLIVEDEAAVGMALEEFVEDAGYDVSGPFTTCAAALASLESRRPDFAIIDTILKDGDCIPLANELKVRGIPFVVFTGWAEEADRPELHGAPRVVKPASWEELRAALGELSLP